MGRMERSTFFPGIEDPRSRPGRSAAHHAGNVVDAAFGQSLRPEPGRGNGLGTGASARPGIPDPQHSRRNARADGTPIALGFHTGHWEVGLLVAEAARELRKRRCIPFAGACTDPCDGRTPGHGRDAGFAALPQRCRNRAAAIDAFAAHTQRVSSAWPPATRACPP
jgi:hypothetical protein